MEEDRERVSSTSGLEFIADDNTAQTVKGENMDITYTQPDRRPTLSVTAPSFQLVT